MPGSISLIQMMIGSLLTALVVSREWERGTIEALLATPVGIVEFIIGKFVPNFVLGMCAMAICVSFALFVFDIPLRGSIFSLVRLHRTSFLLVALSLGLLISTCRANAISGEPDRDDASLFCQGFTSQASCSRWPACRRRCGLLRRLCRRNTTCRDCRRFSLLATSARCSSPSSAMLTLMSVVLLRSRRQHKADGSIEQETRIDLDQLSALIIKELACRFPRSQGAHRVSSCPPIMQFFLLPMRRRSMSATSPIGVLNQDWGMASAQLVSRFERASAFSEIAVTRA